MVLSRIMVPSMVWCQGSIHQATGLIWRLGAPPLRQRLPNCVWRVLIEDLTRFRDDDMSSCMLLVVVGLKKAVIAVSKEWMGMSVD